MAQAPPSMPPQRTDTPSGDQTHVLYVPATWGSGRATVLPPTVRMASPGPPVPAVRDASDLPEGDQTGTLRGASEVLAVPSSRPVRLSNTMPVALSLAVGWTTTASRAPPGAGSAPSDTGTFVRSPRSRLRSAALASSTGRRPASRSAMPESGLARAMPVDGRTGAGTDTNTPRACGSPATCLPAPSETWWPVATETTAM